MKIFAIFPFGQKIFSTCIHLFPLHGSADSLLNTTIALENVQDIVFNKNLNSDLLNFLSSGQYEPKNYPTSFKNTCSINFLGIIWFSVKISFLKYSGFLI